MSKEFCEKAVECLKHDLDSIEDSDLEELDTTMKELCNYSPSLEGMNIVSEISSRFKEYSEYLDANVDSYIDDYRHWPDSFSDSEGCKIDNLFATIRERN